MEGAQTAFRKLAECTDAEVAAKARAKVAELSPKAPNQAAKP